MQGRISKPSRASRLVPMVATAIVLSALMADRAFLKTPPAHAEAYHASVKNAAKNIPATNGPWLGIDVPVPQAAVKMLHPNIIVSRRFRNIVTEETVSILLVHVKDARDLLGHYPPVCYPGQGWKVQSATPAEWSAPQRPVEGTEYRFARDTIEGHSRIVIDNFFVMRGGTICRDMDEVEVAAQDRQRKFFGAAQVQFVHDGNSSPQRRKECVQELLKVMEPTLAAISAEGKA